jgi:hypothetical protein
MNTIFFIVVLVAMRLLHVTDAIWLKVLCYIAIGGGLLLSIAQDYLGTVVINIKLDWRRKITVVGMLVMFACINKGLSQIPDIYWTPETLRYFGKVEKADSMEIAHSWYTVDTLVTTVYRIDCTVPIKELDFMETYELPGFEEEVFETTPKKYSFVIRTAKRFNPQIVIMKLMESATYKGENMCQKTWTADFHAKLRAKGREFDLVDTFAIQGNTLKLTLSQPFNSDSLVKYYGNIDTTEIVRTYTIKDLPTPDPDKVNKLKIDTTEIVGYSINISGDIDTLYQGQLLNHKIVEDTFTIIGGSFSSTPIKTIDLSDYISEYPMERMHRTVIVYLDDKLAVKADTATIFEIATETWCEKNRVIDCGAIYGHKCEPNWRTTDVIIYRQRKAIHVPIKNVVWEQ